jgi:hypothetical protein
MAVEDKVEEEGNEVNVWPHVVLVCNDFGLRGGGAGCTQQLGRGTRW